MPNNFQLTNSHAACYNYSTAITTGELKCLFFKTFLSFFLTLDCPPVLKIFQMDARTAVSSWMLHSPTHGAHNVPFFFRCCCQHTGTLSLDGINLLLPGCRLRSESRTHHARRQPIQSPSSHRCGCFKRFRQKIKGGTLQGTTHTEPH